MSKKTLLEAIIAALIFAAEIIMVLISFFSFSPSGSVNTYFMYVLAIFTNVEVVYGVILLIVNSNKKDK